VRLLVLTHSTRDPSFRVRWGRFASAFEAAGWEFVPAEIPASGQGRRVLLSTAANADVTVLHRRLFRGGDLDRLRRHAKRLVYDFDDALLYRDKPPHRSWQRERRFFAVIRAADLVLAGNRYLAKIARVASKNVRVLPSTVDVEHLAPSEESDPGFVAVWIGQRATLPHLESVREAVLEAGASIPGFKLRVIADAAPAGAEFVPWSEDAERVGLARAHVGLMPLPQNPFTRGKCGYKLLQYYAAGIPAIASPVGVNRVLLDAGGVAARTPAEWTDAVSALAADPARRAGLGAGGRSFVARRYASARLAPRLVGLLNALCSPG